MTVARYPPLEACCEVFTDGDWIETKDQSETGIRLIQTGNIGNGVFKDRLEKARYISTDTFERLRCTEIFKGDVLISRLPDPVGRSCILPSADYRRITAVDCTIVRFDRTIMSPRFFEYYSQTGEYQRAVDQLSTGATRRRISRKNLGSIPMPVPRLSEQERIVASLDEAFAAIDTATENTHRKIDEYASLRFSILSQLMDGAET